MTTPLSIASALGLACGLALAACGDNPSPSPDAGPPTSSRAVVIAGSAASGPVGIASVLDPQAGTVMTNVGPAMAVGRDPIVRHIGDELFIVNRFDLNNITILDEETFALVEQRSTGAGSNPQDVAVVGDKLYVATFNGTGLSVLTRGSDAIEQIEVTTDDPDGAPNCNSIYLAGGQLHVSCGLLDADSFQPRGPGKIYIVDPTTLTVDTDLTVTLTNANPFGLLEEVPPGAPFAGDLLIPTVPDIIANTPNGCIERIAVGATPEAAGCVLQHAELKGYAVRVAVQPEAGASILWTAVSSTDFMEAGLWGHDLSVNSLWPGPLNAVGQKISDLAVCPTGELVVLDTKQGATGLRIYRGGTETTTAPLPIGLDLLSQFRVVCY